MKREKRKVPAMTAITWLLIFVLGFFWAVCMVCITIVTAQEIYEQMHRQVNDFYYEYARFTDLPEEPDRRDYRLMEILSNFGNVEFIHYPGPSEDYGQVPMLISYTEVPVSAAIYFSDAQGDLIFESGDYLYFYYASQESWDAGKEVAESDRFGYISLCRDETAPYAELYDMYAYNAMLFDLSALRITGTFDGQRIEPVRIDYLDYFEVTVAAEQLFAPKKTYSYEISELDRAGVLQWHNLMEVEANNQSKLVTVYALDPRMTVYEARKSQYAGCSYDSMLELIQAVTDPAYDVGKGEYRLNRIMDLDKCVYSDWETYPSGGDPNAVTAVWGLSCDPLAAAIRQLRYVYLMTGLLALHAVLLVTMLIKKKLIRPVASVNTAIAMDWDTRYNAYFHVNMWREADDLYWLFRDEAQKRSADADTVKRLQTALSYARRAEQNRRQMTSNIAHELKTPLAIIHSYAEGLQENIAEEKREQYLETILSETERMDGMVMEMLDLSRLEAGKVTLTRTDFSLSALVSETYEKFAPMAQERNLQVTLELENDCPVIADEARIEQVIRNFLSNAVRYTPEGGTVRIKTETRYYAKGNKVSFSVENTAKHFTDRELIKIWETFYRTDKARSGKGTGLGLAICKNILNLHGGKCTVKNTDLGVEFSFTL